MSFSTKNAEGSFISEIDNQNSESENKLNYSREKTEDNFSNQSYLETQIKEKKKCFSSTEREKLDFLNQIRKLKDQNSKLIENSKVFSFHFYILLFFDALFLKN